MAWGLQKSIKKSVFYIGGRFTRRGRHYEEPGSRDDAVLVVLSILSLSLSLGAGDGVVGHVRDAHAAVRSSRGECVGLG